MSLDRDNILCIFGCIYLLLIMFIENKWYLKENIMIQEYNISANN